MCHQYLSLPGAAHWNTSDPHHHSHTHRCFAATGKTHLPHALHTVPLPGLCSLIIWKLIFPPLTCLSHEGSCCLLVFSAMLPFCPLSFAWKAPVNSYSIQHGVPTTYTGQGITHPRLTWRIFLLQKRHEKCRRIAPFRYYMRSVRWRAPKVWFFNGQFLMVRFTQFVNTTENLLCRLYRAIILELPTGRDQRAPSDRLPFCVRVISAVSSTCAIQARC